MHLEVEEDSGRGSVAEQTTLVSGFEHKLRRW